MQEPNQIHMDEGASPSPSASGTPSHSNSVSRRPPRKSTLTQQQKNQKRQRATQDQLVTLEVEFNKNPTPTAMVRERIASEINMTERSVQIWFQNRFVFQGPQCPRLITNASTGEPRSRTLPRRASRAVRTATTFQSRCVATWRFRPWSPASRYQAAYLVAVALLHTEVVCYSTQTAAPAKLVRSLEQKALLKITPNNPQSSNTSPAVL
jgi:hypothetical protein